MATPSVFDVVHAGCGTLIARFSQAWAALKHHGLQAQLRPRFQQAVISADGQTLESLYACGLGTDIVGRQQRGQRTSCVLSLEEAFFLHHSLGALQVLSRTLAGAGGSARAATHGGT